MRIAWDTGEFIAGPERLAFTGANSERAAQLPARASS
jgi:hypothetical protein